MEILPNYIIRLRCYMVIRLLLTVGFWNVFKHLVIWFSIAWIIRGFGSTQQYLPFSNLLNITAEIYFVLFLLLTRLAIFQNMNLVYSNNKHIIYIYLYKIFFLLYSCWPCKHLVSIEILLKQCIKMDIFCMNCDSVC